MGIRFLCPNGHKLNVKTFLAGKRAICPDCGARVLVPFPVDAEERGTASTDSLRTTVSSLASGSITILPNSDVEFASPSVVVATMPNQAASPEVQPVPISQPAPADDALPDSIIAAHSIQPQSSTDADETPDNPHIMRRQRVQRRQLQIAIMLLCMVIALAVALVWVLRRDAAPQPTAEPETKTTQLFPAVPTSISVIVPSCATYCGDSAT